MKILVRPPYPDWHENKMFSWENRFAKSWMEPYVRLKTAVEVRGWEIATWDMAPLESADLVMFYDLPAAKREFTDARSCAPKIPFILQILETPLNRPHAWDAGNHHHFDAVITYSDGFGTGGKYYTYCLPLGRPQIAIDNPSFDERHPALLMATNRHVGLLAPRNVGAAGLPWIGPVLGGWRVSPAAMAMGNRGELYSRRRQIARLAEAEYSQLMHLYGEGWQGENTSWTHRLKKARPSKMAHGPYRGDKYKLLPKYRFVLAFENMRGRIGYISEKLPDALLAGTVPIYLGEENIAERVDPACYVDARQFRSPRELLEFIRDCPEPAWREWREAGQRFIASDAFAKFESDKYVQTVLACIEHVAAVKEASHVAPRYK